MALVFCTLVLSAISCGPISKGSSRLTSMQPGCDFRHPRDGSISGPIPSRLGDGFRRRFLERSHDRYVGTWCTHRRPLRGLVCGQVEQEMVHLGRSLRLHRRKRSANGGCRVWYAHCWTIDRRYRYRNVSGHLLPTVHRRKFCAVLT